MRGTARLLDQIHQALRDESDPKARAERAAAEKGLHGLCRRGLAGERIGITLKDLLGLNPALVLLYLLAQAFSVAR